MTFGSLFAGIGGFDLGFDRAGLRCVWQVETNEFCRRVLAKHWPDVPKWDDVRTFDGKGFETPDVICGGFPCQDLSRAGKQAGIGGRRSGLWSEFARIVRVVRPRFIVVENVAAILDGGIRRVVGDLAACGYDAEWDCIPACAFGADNIRDRLFLIGCPVPLAPVLHAHGERRGEQHATAVASRPRVLDWPASTGRVRGRHCPAGVEPVLVRSPHGIPLRVDRLRGLGNSVDPGIAEWIGRRLMELS